MKFEKNFSIAYFRERKPIWNALETVLLTVAMLALAQYISPDDPFSLSGPIPWIAIAPIFCGLLYGSLFGTTSLIVVLAYLIFLQPADAINTPIVREYLVGVCTMTFLTGLFSSYWLGRIRHVEYLNRYVREHLDDLSRDYYLLRISHERLEHAYITKPLSFRDAFYQIKQDVLKNNYDVDKTISQQLLNIFSQYCSINCAMFCFYDSRSKALTTMASLGKSFEVMLDDPLIRNAIDNHVTSYFAVNELDDNLASAYLAVVPFLNQQRKIIGFIIIKEMPFWSLTHDNLEVLSVFAAVFSLQFSTVKQVQALVDIFPSCTPEFLREFQTLVTLKKHNKVDSGLSGIMIPEGFFQENIVYSLQQQKRSLDHIWIIPIQSSLLFITLMPLTSLEGIRGFQKRLADWLKSEFGQELNKKGLDFRYQQINHQPVDTQLNDFIKVFSHVDN